MNLLSKLAKIRREHPLVHHLLFYILLCSSAITLLATVFQLYLDYWHDISVIEKQMTQIKTSYLASIMNSLWSIDSEAINLQLQGILQLPDIEYLEIKHSDLDKNYTAGQMPAHTAIISHSIPMSYTKDGEEYYLGVLKVVANLKRVYQRLIDKTLIILISQAIKTFIVSLFILFIVQYLITKHLSQLAAYTRNLNLDNLHTALILNRKTPINDDELEHVTKSINNMRLSLIEDKQMIQENENRLRQILEALPIGVNVFDARGKPYFTNQQAQHISGRSLGQDICAEQLPEFYNLYQKDTEKIYSKTQLPIIQALQGQSTRVDDIEVHQDNRIIPLEVWGAPIFDEQRQITYAISAFQDITERLQREQAERAQEAAEAVNQMFMASLRYAQSIQNSLLPNPTQVTTLPNHFFLWLPKDLVGGDMIYAEAFADSFIVAAIDCTGHGVPGAFMTMVVSTALRRITRDESCYQPSEILKQLNTMVKTSLQQDTEYVTSDDGLDMALCWVNLSEQSLLFAGAKLPLYYIHQNEVHMIKGDKQSLSYKKSDLNFTFTTHTIKIEPDMYFYLSTDDFIDQVGGEKGFSLGNKRFKNLLLENYHFPLSEQGNKLLEAFNDYKNNYDRLDDVTVLGFKV
ncbi:MAG: SpoIIE family protein phosphatase [Thioploca sp.]|nr:SpoIIE family protein phosphatase [Thioploca sp.]